MNNNKKKEYNNSKLYIFFLNFHFYTHALPMH